MAWLDPMIVRHHWPEAPLAYRSLKPSAGDPFAADSLPPGLLRCVRGLGRVQYRPAPAGGCTLLICLRGTLEIPSLDGIFHLRPRQFLCLPNQAFSKVMGEKRSDWIALRIPQCFLRTVTRSPAFLTFARADPLLLPVTLSLTRPLMRRAAELLRLVSAVGETCADEQVGLLLIAALQAQSQAFDWVQRAYGRSERHRRQAVARLLSAYNRIVNAPSMDHDLGTLAAAARYSPSHFLRSFRDVFGKTPHDLRTESRMKMARKLMLGSDLAIGEIATSVGYESRHAFSRLFKRQTGVTASDFRMAAISAIAES